MGATQPRWWRTAKGPAYVPVLFVLSIVTGLVGQIVSRASLFVASGVIFGAAVSGAGRQVLLGVSAASRLFPEGATDLVSRAEVGDRDRRPGET
jgi:hypothetical protein